MAGLAILLISFPLYSGPTPDQTMYIQHPYPTETPAPPPPPEQPATYSAPAAANPIISPAAPSVPVATQGLPPLHGGSKTPIKPTRKIPGSPPPSSVPVLPSNYEFTGPIPEEPQDTRELIMDHSIEAYHGYCACPYSVNVDGYACGVEAAYYKPGGYKLKCYPQDVRNQELIFYRRDH